MNSYADFVKELEEYSTYELELIYETQQNLYTKEEMDIIRAKIEERKAEESDPIRSKMNRYTKEDREKINRLLPEEIRCPKCDGPNSFSNDRCEFCGAVLEKEKYYSLEYYENSEYNRSGYRKAGGGNGFRYFISFLIPLVGFIMGAILLAKDDAREKSAGKGCILFALLSTISSAIVCAMYAKIIFDLLL